MSQNNNEVAFFALLIAGLWYDVKSCPAPVADYLSRKDKLNVNYGEVLRLSEEQSVLGLVAAGAERLTVCNISPKEKLTLLGKCQLIDHRNLEMNAFLADLTQRMREAGIDAVLVKGQGIAQYYAKPLWRTSGDVDFLLDKSNYEKAKTFLKPLAGSIEKESIYNQHLGMTIDGYSVELHGNLRCGLSKRMDVAIDDIQQEVCIQGKRRNWQNDNVAVSVPSPNEDVVLIFTHFLKHFYKGGLGLRQICDWCRLLWVFRGAIDHMVLETHLRKMGLTSEWKGFAAFAVDFLGMPVDTMPLYDPSLYWNRKANRIKKFVMRSGNFGHNRDVSYMVRYPYLFRKVISIKYRQRDMLNHFMIFPFDTLRFCPSILRHGLSSMVRGG